MTTQWRPPSFVDLAKRLADDPAGAGRDLDQAIQQIYRRVETTGTYHGAGASDARPRPAAASVGSSYFDSTLGHVIWWNGKQWIDATGKAV